MVPREGNELADYINQIRDFDDWMINPCLFQFLEHKWGPHTVDYFAGEHNSQTPRFYSGFWCPGSEAVDVFTVNWDGEMYWLVPPLHLVSRALCHARAYKARGTLVILMWKSTPDSSLLAISFDFLRPPRQFNIGFCPYNSAGVCNRCAITWSS